jgi:hypothetical protein
MGRNRKREPTSGSDKALDSIEFMDDDETNIPVRDVHWK